MASCLRHGSVSMSTLPVSSCLAHMSRCLFMFDFNFPCSSRSVLQTSRVPNFIKYRHITDLFHWRPISCLFYISGLNGGDILGEFSAAMATLRELLSTFLIHSLMENTRISIKVHNFVFNICFLLTTRTERVLILIIVS